MMFYNTYDWKLIDVVDTSYSFKIYINGIEILFKSDICMDLSYIIQNIENAHKAICKAGLLINFLNFDKILEKIQKSLDDYLELKRQQFPRFYFLSNENLLDILGQAKDPQNVQV